MSETGISPAARCKVPMVHPDGSEEQCTRHRDHVEQDTDHVDVHGHRAPVLVHQSTIEHARAWQGVPWPWEANENSEDPE